MESSASAVLDPRRWWALALLCGAFFMVLLEAEHAPDELARAFRDFLVTPMQPASQP
jgi:hypothetical protein